MMLLSPFSHIKKAEKAFNWHKHIFRDDLLMRAAHARGCPPVVVYSMPKTGSAAVYKALRKARGVLALKSHTLRPEHWRKRRLDPAWMPSWTGMWRDHWHSDALVHRRILQAQRPARFIALVRDPVATNLSAFIYFARYWFADQPGPPRLRALSDEQLEAAFFDRYPHYVTTDWFDLEPRHTLGINVYDEPFPHEQGWHEYANGPFRLLVLRLELDDRIKSEQIARFVGAPAVRIKPHNTADQHGLRPLQDRLRAIIARNPDYTSRLIDHPYTAHFWTPAERDAMRARWQAR